MRRTSTAKLTIFGWQWTDNTWNEARWLFSSRVYVVDDAWCARREIQWLIPTARKQHMRNQRKNPRTSDKLFEFLSLVRSHSSRFICDYFCTNLHKRPTINNEILFQKLFACLVRWMKCQWWGLVCFFLRDGRWLTTKRCVYACDISFQLSAGPMRSRITIGNFHVKLCTFIFCNAEWCVRAVYSWAPSESINLNLASAFLSRVPLTSRY